MIDGIHFEIPPDAIYNSDILEFKYYGDKHRVKYNSLIIDRYTHTCKVNGSIHKYFNNGEHNYNDFTLEDCKSTINDISKVLNINPEVTRIGRIEVGVNIDLGTDMDVNEFLSCIFMLDHKTPEPLGQIGFIFKFKEYDLKIYRKELKGQPDKLRIELVIKHKTKRTAIIKEYTTYCNTLEDLTNSNVWNAFGAELVKVFEKVIIIDKDKIDYTSLSTKELILLVKGGNSFYWKKNWSRQTRSNNFKRFLNIINTEGNSIQDEIKVKMKAKIDDLIHGCSNSLLATTC